MLKNVPEEALSSILAAVERFPGGASRSQIAKALTPASPPRTLQFQLRRLVAANRLVLAGKGRAARYSLPQTQAGIPSDPSAPARPETPAIPLSPASIALRAYLSQPVAVRKPASYNRQFLDAYRPNESFYLTSEERAHLAEVGSPKFADAPDGWSRAAERRGKAGASFQYR